MELPKGIVLLDSLGDLQPENSCPILVCGSHCGGNHELALHVKNCKVQAVFLNNAGIGKNQAGIKGLSYYQSEGILACDVDHNSAEIGISSDTWENGIISHINALAEKVGITKGDSVQNAVAILMNNAEILSPSQNSIQHDLSPTQDAEIQSKQELKKQTQIHIEGVTITVTDSITFLHEHNAGDIVVCGSHGGLSAGEYAQKYKVKAVFFNDAGIGKNNAGVQSLEILSAKGILACTVDCMTAEIFNGQDVLEHGVISVCNERAKAKNIQKNMKVAEAIKLL